MEQGKRVRISVANLCPYIKNRDTGETLAVGIVDKKKLKLGIWKYHALGGGAWMTPEGKKILEEKFSAVFLGEGEDANDARFTISEQHVASVLEMFETSSSEFCEISPFRELKEELEMELINGHSVVEEDELDNAQSSLLRVFRQESAEDGVGASERASTEVPTRRLFYVHMLVVPNGTFEEIVNNKYIRCFTEKELDTTEMGRLIGLTNTGEIMADNLSNYMPGLIYHPGL